MSALRLEHDDGIAIVTIDLPGASVNKVSAALRTEFAELFGGIESDTTVKGVVLMTGKPDTWIAGADIDEFLAMHGVTDAESLSRGGQALLARLESLRVPVVAAIHGACLGAGLETALACHYRVASDHPKTVLALPEVQLGIIPGAGGTARLPRLIGLAASLDLMLTGKQLDGRRARSAGIVDETVPAPILLREAKRAALALADGKLKPKGARRRGSPKFAENLPGLRGFIFRKARQGPGRRFGAGDRFPDFSGSRKTVGVRGGARDGGSSRSLGLGRLLRLRKSDLETVGAHQRSRHGDEDEA